MDGWGDCLSSVELTAGWLNIHIGLVDGCGNDWMVADDIREKLGCFT